ncbi:MAG: DUF4282 domain-containing protein [Arenicella sp.]|nr:DUF4282 domain-containing protein [Arenicella sp.]
MLDKINEFIAKPLPQQILYFNEMLTPKLIQLAYWLALVAVVWTGLEKIFSGGLAGLLEGIVHIAVGGILVRVVAEVVMLFFQMQGDMETLAKNSAKPAPRKATAKKTSKKVTKK